MRRSVENAEHVGLYTRDHLREIALGYYVADHPALRDDAQGLRRSGLSAMYELARRDRELARRQLVHPLVPYYNRRGNPRQHAHHFPRQHPRQNPRQAPYVVDVNDPKDPFAGRRRR